MKPLILITNDDGIQAEGIHCLADCVKNLGEVIVAAPSGPQSGGSSAITVEHPLKIKQHPDYNGAKMYSINGTPVDCVKLALHAIVDRRPALVLSGINHGSNTGNSVVYSGTMGAAREGALKGIPSIGFSLTSHKADSDDFNRAAPWVTKIVKAVLEKSLPQDVCLNINMPVKREITGIAWTQSCRGEWVNEYQEYTDPHGGKFYCITGDYKNLDPNNNNTDLAQLAQGKITVTPVTTYHDAILTELPFS